MNLSEVLSYNVRRLMASKSPPWTNAKLGEAIGVASPHISPLLKGIVWPSAERIQKIADVLGVVPAMLFIPPCEKPKRRRVRPEHHEFNAEKISTLLDSQDHESGREVMCEPLATL
jgi:transcriptional regulator with XRE-family HTH domain